MNLIWFDFFKCKCAYWTSTNRHFSVAPYIAICPSTETYFGLYLRGAMSAVTGIYLFSSLANSSYSDEMLHDGISPVCKCKKHVMENIFHN